MAKYAFRTGLGDVITLDSAGANPSFSFLDALGSMVEIPENDGTGGGGGGGGGAATNLTPLDQAAVNDPVVWNYVVPQVDTNFVFNYNGSVSSVTLPADTQIYEVKELLLGTDLYDFFSWDNNTATITGNADLFFPTEDGTNDVAYLTASGLPTDEHVYHNRIEIHSGGKASEIRRDSDELKTVDDSLSAIEQSLSFFSILEGPYYYLSSGIDTAQYPDPYNCPLVAIDPIRIQAGQTLQVSADGALRIDFTIQSDTTVEELINFAANAGPYIRIGIDASQYPNLYITSVDPHATLTFAGTTGLFDANTGPWNLPPISYTAGRFLSDEVLSRADIDPSVCSSMLLTDQIFTAYELIRKLTLQVADLTTRVQTLENTPSSGSSNLTSSSNALVQ